MDPARIRGRRCALLPKFRTGDTFGGNIEEVRLRRACGVFILLLAVFSIWLPSSHAMAGDGGRPMSLREVLALAIEQNPDIRAAGIDVEQADQGIRIADGTFDVYLSSSLQWDHSTRRDYLSQSILEWLSSDKSQGDVFSQQGVNLRLSASKLFATGTTATLSLNHGWDEYETFVSREIDAGSSEYSRGFRSVWTTDVRLTLTQPLLRGFWLDPNLAGIRAAEVLRDETKILEENQASKVLARVARAYWDLFLARSELEIRRSSLQLAKEQDRVSRLNVEAGRLPELAIFQTANAVAAREEAVVLAEAGLGDAAARLALQLDLPSTESPLPTDEPTPDFSEVVRDRVSEETLRRNPQLLAARKDLERREQMLISARDRVWPDLDLFGSVGTTAYASLGDQGGENYGDSWSELFDRDGLNFAAGLLFSYPLGNDAAEGDLERRVLDRKQALLRVKQLEDSLVSQVEAAVRYVVTNRKRIEVTRQALVYAEKRLTAERALFDTGRATTRDVLEAQDVLERSRQSEARAKVDLVKSRITLQDLTGGLLASLGMEVK